MTTPKIVSLQEIEKVTGGAEFDIQLIEAIAQGYVDFSASRFNLCPIQTMGAPPMAPFLCKIESETSDEDYAAQVCVKSGYVTGDPYFVLKVASGGRPLPQNDGLMQVYSQRTGSLQALLLDQGILTELRTAAAGAVAVREFLGSSDAQNAGRTDGPAVERIGMIGTGIQARFQLRYLRKVTACRDLLLWGRSKDKVETLKKELESKHSNDDDTDGWNVSVAEDPAELIRSCTIIVTTTTARSPILQQVPPSGHARLIVCIGADSVGKQELSSDLVGAANLLVCDSKGQTVERGEFQHALRERKVQLEEVVEIGEVVGTGRMNQVRMSGGLVIFDASGVAVQDCVVAKMVYESL